MEVGTTTQNLRPTQELPEEEQATQRRGRRFLIAGIAIDSLAVVACLIGMIFDVDNRIAEDLETLAMLAFISFVALGASLIVVGGIESVQRKARTRLRLNSDGIDRLSAQTQSLAADMDERFRVLMGLIGPVAGQVDRFAEKVETGGADYLKRLERIEKAIGELPDYGQGVIDGAQMRARVLGHQP